MKKLIIPEFLLAVLIVILAGAGLLNLSGKPDSFVAASSPNMPKITTFSPSTLLNQIVAIPTLMPTLIPMPTPVPMPIPTIDSYIQELIDSGDDPEVAGCIVKSTHYQCIGGMPEGDKCLPPWNPTPGNEGKLFLMENLATNSCERIEQYISYSREVDCNQHCKAIDASLIGECQPTTVTCAGQSVSSAYCSCSD